MRRKNPFKGIAHSNGSSYSQRYFRHVEGARDSRRSSRHFGIHRAIRHDMHFVDINPVPVSFCE